MKRTLKTLEERNYTKEMIVVYLKTLLLTRETNFNKYPTKLQPKIQIEINEIKEYLTKD